MVRLLRNRYALLFPMASVFCALLLLLLLSRTPASEPPSLDDAVYKDPSLSVEERVADLLAHMTLEEKIGQMALVEKNSISPEDAARWGIGGILSGAGAKPENNTPGGWREMIGAYVSASRHSRLGIPVLYGLDANHGHGNVPGATVFPHAIGLGAAGDPDLVERVARATAEEASATGVSWNYSPSLDLPSDIRWGRVYEAFSNDPALVSELGAAYIRGTESAGLAASAKHFLGAGDMRWGSSSNRNFHIDQGATPADERALRQWYLPPFRAAVESGAKTVMVGLNAWGDTKMSAHRGLVTDILKGELGFEGFVVSDWYGVYEIARDKYRAATLAINAGVDMVMLPFEYQMFVHDVTRAVHAGAIPEERIDDAAQRILRAKFAMGLFEEDESLSLDTLGSSEHRALAREAAGRSVVILKNNDVLPLSKRGTIRVAGSAADNIGMQAGAWTVEWQGIDGSWLPGATSILSGIRAVAGDNADVQYDVNGIFVDDAIADVGIAVVGEKPYAEGWGDNPEPRLTDADLESIAKLQKSVRKLVVVIVSGRPLIITEHLGGWDALAAAWLPGSEGAGVADALFGEIEKTGALPLTWPRTTAQLPIEPDGSTVDGTSPLFPRGFGLQLR